MATVAGMLPLARELLKRGVAVIMAANERASINDTTAAELSVAVQSAAREDKLLRRALDEQALSVMSSGSDMPVIDLSRVRAMGDPAFRVAVLLMRGAVHYSGHFASGLQCRSLAGHTRLQGISGFHAHQNLLVVV